MPVVTKFFMLALVLFGCATREPPGTFSIGDGFSVEEKEVIRAATDAWCDKVGWCPEEVAATGWGNIELVFGGFQMQHPEDCPEGDTCSVDAHNGGERVQVWADSPRRGDLEYFWVIVAHELGHYCISEHPDTGLMSPRHEPGSDPLSIDDVAARAWREGCDL